jgi:hypothetical protein
MRYFLGHFARCLVGVSTVAVPLRVYCCNLRDLPLPNFDVSHPRCVDLIIQGPAEKRDEFSVKMK